MNDSYNNEKIEEYINELADEYKRLLLNALISRSKFTGDLSVSELLRLDNEIKKPLLEDYRKEQRKRRRLFCLGLTYMFMGFFFFVIFDITKGNFYYETTNVVLLMSIIVSLVGLVTSIFSLVPASSGLLLNRNVNVKKEKFTALLEYEVVTKWRELEGLVNDISLNADVKTPHSVIRFLVNNQFVDENEYNLLKVFLTVRNDIVHSTGITYSSNEIKELIDKIDNIIKKIKKIV